MHEADDAAAVARCLAGDTEAFAELINRYQGPVFNIALRMLRDREDARDITQSAFIKAYENLRSFDPKYRFFSWLYRIAMNESLNHIKRRSGLLQASREWFFGRPVSAPPQSESDGDDTARLEQALMTLKPDHRAVILLKHLSEHSYRDVSEILGIPEKTVKSRLFEARRALRQALIAVEP